MTDTAALVVRARIGDADAFATLVDTYLPRFVGTASAIMGSRGAADDPLQEAFVRAWRSLHQLREPERFEAWLRRLVVNACLSDRRTARRLDEAMATLRGAHRDVPGPEDSLVARDELDRALARLPQEQRAILVLRYLDDLPGEDIAAALGVPTGTARRRLHHAVVALRTALDDEGRDDTATALKEAT